MKAFVFGVGLALVAFGCALLAFTLIDKSVGSVAILIALVCIAMGGSYVRGSW